MLCCKFCLAVGSAAIVAAAVGLSIPAAGQPDKARPAAPGAQPQGQPSPDDMMKQMQESIAPVEQHKQMARLVGEWESSVKIWMDPAAPPMESTGTCVNKAIMGGRYIEGDFTGTMMNMPFEGKMIWAYNKVSGKYESTWIDNFGTAISFSDDGAYDPAKRAYTSTLTMWDPGMGKMSAHQVVTVVDDNTHKMEMFAPGPDGKQMKMMEVTYTRKAGAKPPSSPNPR